MYTLFTLSLPRDPTKPIRSHDLSTQISGWSDPLDTQAALIRYIFSSFMQPCPIVHRASTDGSIGNVWFHSSELKG